MIKGFYFKFKLDPIIKIKLLNTILKQYYRIINFLNMNYHLKAGFKRLKWEYWVLNFGSNKK